MPYADLKETAPAGRPQPMFFVGGFLLTVLAGAVNVAMLSFYAVPVSHMSGAVSRLGMDLGARRYADLPVIGMIIAAFALGCVLTGALVGSNTLADRNRYTWVLACEVAALGAAAALLGGAVHASVVLCACACGVQNAMASSYYGLVVRTTHVTGIITDLGFMVGARLSGRRFAPWKYLLLCLLVTRLPHRGERGGGGHAHPARRDAVELLRARRGDRHRLPPPPPPGGRDLRRAGRPPPVEPPRAAELTSPVAGGAWAAT